MRLPHVTCEIYLGVLSRLAQEQKGLTPRTCLPSSLRSRSLPLPCSQAEVRLPYVTCEFYLGVLSRLAPEPLWLGSAPGLRSPAPLAEAAVSHVLLLCRAAAPSPAAGSSAAQTALPDGTAAAGAFSTPTAEAGVGASEAGGGGDISPGRSPEADAQAAGGSESAGAALGATAEAQAAGFGIPAAVGLAAAAAAVGAGALLLDALGDGAVRAAVRSCAAAGAACTLVPLPPPQVGDTAVRCHTTSRPDGRDAMLAPTCSLLVNRAERRKERRETDTTA